MSVTITTYPKKVIDSEPLQVSRWQAIWNNLIYKIQRKDFLVTSVASDSGSPELAVVTVTGTLPSLVADDVIYLNTTLYTGSFTVLSATSNTISIDTAYLGTSTGYTNLTSIRPNYYLEVNILQKSGATYTTYATDKRVADTAGLITVDIASYVRSMVNMENENPYTDRTYPDTNLSAIVNITYTEKWTGSTETESAVDEDEDYYIVNSAMQKLNEYGSNQGEWVPFPPGLASPEIEQHKGKFLSDFDKPTYWEGYPFDLSFIYPKDFEDSDILISVVEQLYNINRSLQSSTNEFIDQDTNKVVRLMLNGSYSSLIKTVDVHLNASTTDDANDIIWGITGGTPNIIYVLNSFGIDNTIIGNAVWNTDMNTTMADLANSINTNTDDDPTDATLMKASTGFGPFDNSAGFTANYTAPYLVLTPPAGSKDALNGVNAYLYSWNGSAITLTPSGSQQWTGGSDAPVDVTGLTTARVTEIKTVKIGHVCESPVYLCWQNKYGGKSYWLFQGIQQESVTTKIDASINRYTEDIADQNTDQDIISISSGHDLVVGSDNVLSEDIEGLVGLKQSARVMMLVDVANLVWQTVIIKPGTFALPDTDAAMGDVRFTLQLADDNLQGQ